MIGCRERYSALAQRITGLGEFVTRAAFDRPDIHRRFTRGTAWYLLFGIISQGSAVLISIGVARALGAAGFGRLGIIQSTTTLFGTAAGLGLGLATMKAVAEYRSTRSNELGSIVGAASMLTGLLGCACSLLMFVLSPAIASRLLGASDLARLLAIASLTVALTAVNSTQLGALAGLELYRPLAQSAVVRSILSVPMCIMAAWHWGLTGAVWSTNVAGGITCVVTGLYLRRSLGRSAITVTYRLSLPSFKTLLGVGLPTALGGLSLVPVGWYANTLLVRQIAGYSALGVFIAADKWRTMICFVPNYMSGVALSMLSHSKGADDKTSYDATFRGAVLCVCGFTALSAVSVVLMSQTVLGVFGGEFASGRAILVVLAASSIPVVLNTMLGYRLISSGRVWQRFALDGLLAITLLCSSVWLIPKWSGLGMAFAAALSYSLVCVALVARLSARVPRFVCRIFQRFSKTTATVDSRRLATSQLQAHCLNSVNAGISSVTLATMEETDDAQ